MASLAHLMVKWFLALALAMLPIVSAQATELGREIINTAKLTYSENGRRATVLTNEALIVVEARRTASTIEFFRYSPLASNALQRSLNGSDYRPNGEDIFLPVGPAVTSGGAVIDTSRPVPLTPAEAYLTGELMIVRVIDPGQNGYDDRIETIVTTVSANNGDTITLRLYESAPDSGEFLAYVPSTREATDSNDASLTTGEGTKLTATYIDSFDSTEVSVDTALVDPHGRVFNAMNGQMLDGIEVTLIDINTNRPATVIGVDGVSRFPATVTTGERITDGGGLHYDLESGEFRFPMVAPGTYELQVELPERLMRSSITDEAHYTSLDHAPYTIIPASFGREFVVETWGPLAFDVPLDPESDIVISKTAEADTVDAGDYVRYTVSVANSGSDPMQVTLMDVIPVGFRYQAGSSRLTPEDSETIETADPEIGRDGRVLRYALGIFSPGDEVELSYVLHAGANLGTDKAVNKAYAIDANGQAVSNIARAPLTIREDLFRRKSTIIGGIFEQACEEDEDWAREIRDGIGIEGVRVYMETGDYAVTDEDGLYHFEGVSEGTHVVQIDKETLPAGYEPMICEENSRYAGRATSKFVDVKGGNIWRANFYLKYTGADEAAEDEQGFNDLTEYQDYDADWLSGQDAAPEWVYPEPSRTPSQPSVNVGIKHGPDHRVTLALNGKAVAKENFAARDSDPGAKVYISRWRGVDLRENRNVFVATVTDGDGNTVKTLTREIWFVDTAARAVPVVDRSVLVADGRTPPVLAVRLENEDGRPVHTGRIVGVEVEPPYRLDSVEQREDAAELVAPLAARGTAAVGRDGIARIKLAPTLQTGRVKAKVSLDDGRQETVEMYLTPEKRDWIVVGLAEGTVGYERIKRNASGAKDDRDIFTDGRVAFFAKGLIKGEWLLTLAVDTDKRRGNRDGDFRDEIDPDAYYTLYGDRTYQEVESPSRYPLYVKIERDQFYAMFGDYDTNIVDGKLTRYTRRLSGIKTEYVGERVEVVAFGAETNQGFVKDEIASNGTSGSYRLSNAPILADSETIVVETRERFRPDRVLETRTLVRHIDYTLDTETGELILRLPIPVTDAAFNPNVLVIDYETSKDAERKFTYGARAAGHFLDGAVTVGATYIHEGGDSTAADSDHDLLGVDIVAQITDTVEARVEAAQSRSDLNGERKTGNAWLAEIVHRSQHLTAEAYARQEDADFGIGQQDSTTAGIRRIGLRAALQIDSERDEDTGSVTTRNASLDVYHEKNLETGARRLSGDVQLSQSNERWGISTGVRHVRDDLPGGETRETSLALIGVQLQIPEFESAITASHEQPLTGNGVDSFPQRSTVGFTKTLNRWADIVATHQYSVNEDVETHTTTAGFKIKPWTGAVVTLGSDMLTSDSARRIGSTVGIDQELVIDENWTASAGLTNHRVLSGSGQVDVAPDDAISPVETGEDYFAGYAGLAYRDETLSASTRLEGRGSDTEDVFTASASAVRELSEELSLAGSARAQYSRHRDGNLGDDSTKADMKLGLAWRPRTEDMVILDRIDVKYDENRQGAKTTKIVNNFAVNSPVGERAQLAGHYGVKYVTSDFGGVSYSGWTHLLGAEARYDVTRRIDLGIHGSILYTPGSGTKAYAWGPSIGVSPIDNTWLSLGYNFSGFDDEDFEGARYSREGLYLKLRMKFDEDTARSILNFVSPE